MKAQLAVFIFCSGIFYNGLTFACGDSNDLADKYGYQNTRSGACQCTDPGARWNDCMSNAEYCEAFGNIGER